jgi:hypothetical protein
MKSNKPVKFKGFTVMNTQITVQSYMMPYNLVYRYQYFGEPYCLHLLLPQDRGSRLL